MNLSEWMEFKEKNKHEAVLPQICYELLHSLFLSGWWGAIAQITLFFSL